MLRKVRLQFIIVALSLSFLVLASIMVGMITSMVINNRNASFKFLDENVTIAKEDFNAIENDNVFVFKSLPNGQIEIKRDGVKYFADQTEFEDLVGSILLRNHKYGKIDYCYYVMEKTDDYVLIVGADMVREEKQLSNNIFNTMLLGLAGLVLIALIAWASSFWIIKPAEDALKKQKRFISDASHELKTPIAIISANAEVLANQTGNEEWVDNIMSQTIRMRELVAELLALARIDEMEKAPEKSQFDLKQAFLTSVLPFEMPAYENGKALDVSVDENCTYYGHMESFTRVVTILTDNAVKYANDGTTILVKLAKLSEKYREKYQLIVYNEGCGIDEENKDKLFERFYRLESSRDRKKGGNGLGLAIAKGLCDINGWKITVDCKFDEYTRFTVSL